MQKQLTSAWWMTLMLMCMGTAQAQPTVWRCGPGGNSYSNQPCAAGRTVGVDDSRSSADVQAGRDVAVRDRAMAQRMHKERLQREAEQRAQGSGLGGFAATKPAAPAVVAQVPAIAKVKAKTKAKTKDKATTPTKPPQPAAAGTSTKAARSSRRAQG